MMVNFVNVDSRFSGACIMLTVVLLKPVPAIECKINSFNVFKGWTTVTTSGSYTADTTLACAMYVSNNESQAMFTLATYNKTSLACKIIASIPQNIILHYSGEDNDLVLWDGAGCATLKDVFKEHFNQDLGGFDYAYQQQLSIDSCITYCGQVYPQYKGIEYNYAYTSSSGGLCYCKSISKQEFLHQSGTLRPIQNWSYYERLC